MTKYKKSWKFMNNKNPKRIQKKSKNHLQINLKSLNPKTNRVHNKIKKRHLNKKNKLLIRRKKKMKSRKIKKVEMKNKKMIIKKNKRQGRKKLLMMIKINNKLR